MCLQLAAAAKAYRCLSATEEIQKEQLLYTSCVCSGERKVKNRTGIHPAAPWAIAPDDWWQVGGRSISGKVQKHRAGCTQSSSFRLLQAFIFITNSEAFSMHLNHKLSLWRRHFMMDQTISVSPAVKKKMLVNKYQLKTAWRHRCWNLEVWLFSEN